MHYKMLNVSARGPEAAKSSQGLGISVRPWVGLHGCSNNNNKHHLSTCYVPSMVLRALHVLYGLV